MVSVPSLYYLNTNGQNVLVSDFSESSLVVFPCHEQ